MGTLAICYECLQVLSPRSSTGVGGNDRAQSICDKENTMSSPAVGKEASKTKTASLGGKAVSAQSRRWIVLGEAHALLTVIDGYSGQRARERGRLEHS